ncbi:hypothetical protein ACOMHN_011374 [Nucella lapillus]
MRRLLSLRVGLCLGLLMSVLAGYLMSSRLTSHLVYQPATLQTIAANISGEGRYRFPLPPQPQNAANLSHSPRLSTFSSVVAAKAPGSSTAIIITSSTTRTSSKQAVYSRFIIDPLHNLLYCPLEKVGSSFWKRVFQLLKGIGHAAKNTSVFDLSGVRVHAVNGMRTVNKLLWRNISDFLSTAKKFMFVRDPYERLFSGFIDKIFIPTLETDTIVNNVFRSLHFSKRYPTRLERSFERMSAPCEFVSRHLFDGNDAVTVSSERHKRKTKGYLFQQETPEKQNNVEQIAQTFDDSNKHVPMVNKSYIKNITKRSNYLRSTFNITQRLMTNLEKRNLHKNGNIDHIRTVQENSLLLSDRFHHNHLRCKLSVTFADFVHYVIKGANVNEHFRPMWEHCPPCLLRYDFLGKMETFQPDVHSILTSAGVNPLSVLSSDVTFDRDSDLNILHDVTTRTFVVMEKYRQCMKQEKILARMWTGFQVRGLLSIKQPFPLSEENANHVTKQQFTQIVDHAYAQSGPRAVRMRQRKAAMLEAFYSLPCSLLQGVETYVKKDCQLFGYECSVENRFHPKDSHPPVFHLDKFMLEDDLRFR